MVLDGVDVFVKVVEAGGFSAAARRLAMPATTVSAKIARLEERLGVTLIQRSTRRMHVTPAGEAYYAHCAEALRALEAGEAQLEAASEAPSGLLRLTAPADATQHALIPIVMRYLKTYSRVSVELLVTNTPLDLLAEGVDLALRASPMRDSTLQSRKFGSGRLRLFASPTYLKRRGTPKVAADLAGHDVLVHSRFPAGAMRLMAGKEVLNVKPNSRIRTDDMQTIMTFALEGAGIALIPEFSAEATRGLVPVLPDYGSAPASIYFVYPAGRFTPPNVRAFIDMAVGKD
jgi:DNA-binding transcriptional LysR family regulator